MATRTDARIPGRLLGRGIYDIVEAARIVRRSPDDLDLCSNPHPSIDHQHSTLTEPRGHPLLHVLQKPQPVVGG